MVMPSTSLPIRPLKRSTVPYDTAAFVAKSRAAGVTPHVARNINAHRGSIINGRTTRHPGYRVRGQRLDQGDRRHRANQAARGSSGLNGCLCSSRRLTT
jgi:hypothetical protein